MDLPEPRLEACYARWGDLAPHRLSASHAEPLTLAELLALAGPEERDLWDRLSLGYAASRGRPELREEIAGLYGAVGPGGVLTFAGAQEGIFATFAALLEPGDRVVTIRPCYEYLETVPRALGAEVVPVELRVRDGTWRLDLDELEAAAGPGTRLIAVNFPHNPTGADLTAVELSRVVRIAGASGAWLFCDEVFRLLAYDGREPRTPVADMYPRGISLDVMSKAFGLGGVRVGWIATQAVEVVDVAMKAKSYTSICNGTPDEVLALTALRARGTILERNLGIIELNLGNAASFFARHEARFGWEPPRSGCLAFPELLDGTDVEETADRLAREAGILMLPAPAFLSSGNRFRLGLGPAALPEVLNRLEAWLPSA